jgi:pimeloyl-ACP methyl ester carboxylesterase
MKRWIWIVLWAVVWAPQWSRNTWADAPPKPTAEADAQRPYLSHLPGVAGETIIDHWMLEGLADGGVDADVHLIDWTGEDPGIKALWAHQRNLQQAQLVADQITQQFRSEPDRPIYLTSHSGGTGIAVWALERLPDDVRVQSVLLIAPALSPEYDLSKALSHVKTSMYAFSSRLDFAVLGAGTRLFGTIDGVKTDAAGLVGFVRPAVADVSAYRKLISMPYDPAWMRLGNIGDHIGPMSTIFAQKLLAPILMTGKVPELAKAPATQPAAAAAVQAAGE